MLWISPAEAPATNIAHLSVELGFISYPDPDPVWASSGYDWCELHYLPIRHPTAAFDPTTDIEHICIPRNWQPINVPTRTKAKL